MEKLKLSAFADEASAALTEQIKALKENDIPYIEVRGVDGKNISTDPGKMVVKILGMMTEIDLHFSVGVGLRSGSENQLFHKYLLWK